MKLRSLFLALTLASLVACQKSEITDKPAAAVTETSATTANDTALTSTPPAAGATTVNVIKEKSSIHFVAAKVTRDHKGEFKSFDGSLEYSGGAPSRISFDIALNSIETDTPDLTKHLQTADFFDVAKFPKATFTSSSITAAPAGSPPGTTHVVTGTLNMHGVDKAVSFPVVATVAPDSVHTTSEFTINRQDWGISYKGAADDLIKDNVLIKLDLMFPPPPAS
ncbi:MAG: YceI family protein [Acidobacteriota bacterium]